MQNRVSVEKKFSQTLSAYNIMYYIRYNKQIVQVIEQDDDDEWKKVVDWRATWCTLYNLWDNFRQITFARFVFGYRTW